MTDPVALLSGQQPLRSATFPEPISHALIVLTHPLDQGKFLSPDCSLLCILDAAAATLSIPLSRFAPSRAVHIGGVIDCSLLVPLLVFFFGNKCGARGGLFRLLVVFVAVVVVISLYVRYLMSVFVHCSKLAFR